MERFAERDRLTSYSFYVFYKKEKYRTTLSQRDFFKVVKTIWKVVARNLLERQGGVLLDRFGYLCHWMTPKKKIFKYPVQGSRKLATNSHTEGYWYNTALFSEVFAVDPLKGWSLDRSFNLKIKEGRWRQQLKGMKYKFYFSLVRSTQTHLKKKFYNED